MKNLNNGTYGKMYPQNLPFFGQLRLYEVYLENMKRAGKVGNESTQVAIQETIIDLLLNGEKAKNPVALFYTEKKSREMDYYNWLSAKGSITKKETGKTPKKLIKRKKETVYRSESYEQATMNGNINIDILLPVNSFKIVYDRKKIIDICKEILTKRETVILQGVLDEKPLKDIAEDLNLKYGTVKSLKSRLISKLSVNKQLSYLFNLKDVFSSELYSNPEKELIAKYPFKLEMEKDKIDKGVVQVASKRKKEITSNPKPKLKKPEKISYGNMFPQNVGHLAKVPYYVQVSCMYPQNAFNGGLSVSGYGFLKVHNEPTKQEKKRLIELKTGSMRWYNTDLNHVSPMEKGKAKKDNSFKAVWIKQITEKPETNQVLLEVLQETEKQKAKDKNHERYFQARKKEFITKRIEQRKQETKKEKKARLQRLVNYL